MASDFYVLTPTVTPTTGYTLGAYTYTVMAGRDAIVTGENEATIDASGVLTLKTGNKFTFTKSADPTTIVIKVTVTATDSEDGTKTYPLTYWLEIQVEA